MLELDLDEYGDLLGVVEVELLFCDEDVVEVFEEWECFIVFARQVFNLKNFGVREVCIV